LLYWLIMGIVLHNNIPDTPYLLRPYLQIKAVMGQYDANIVFPWWIYLRNCPFYGIMASLLIIPGLVMAFKRKGECRLFALAWVLAVLILHLLCLREVRYLAFLMPLSACLIVPPLKEIFSRQSRFLGFILIMLLADLFLAGNEALRLRHSFYRHNQLQKYLAIITDKRPRPVLLRKFLAFHPPCNSPFAGDRYHRVFHFGPRHLRIFMDYREKDVIWVKDMQDLKDGRDFQLGGILLFASELLVNRPGLLPGPPRNAAEFAEFTGVAEKFPLLPAAGAWDIAGGGQLRFIPRKNASGDSAVIG